MESVSNTGDSKSLQTNPYSKNTHESQLCHPVVWLLQQRYKSNSLCDILRKLSSRVLLDSLPGTSHQSRSKVAVVGEYTSRQEIVPVEKHATLSGILI